MPETEGRRVLLSPQADRDLEDIWRYTAETWSLRQADFYIDEIEALFALIAGMPGIAREWTEFDPPVRLFPHGQHVIVYRVEGDGVLVVRILGGKQDCRRMLQASSWGTPTHHPFNK